MNFNVCLLKEIFHIMFYHEHTCMNLKGKLSLYIKGPINELSAIKISPASFVDFALPSFSDL